MTSENFIDLPPLLNARGTITLPGSKSISNRILLLSALAQGRTEIRDVLLSDDTGLMLDGLRTLGVVVEQLESHVFRVQGCGANFPVKQAEFFLGNAGSRAQREIHRRPPVRQHERREGQRVFFRRHSGGRTHQSRLGARAARRLTHLGRAIPQDDEAHSPDWRRAESRLCARGQCAPRGWQGACYRAADLRRHRRARLGQVL